MSTVNHPDHVPFDVMVTYIFYCPKYKYNLQGEFFLYLQLNLQVISYQLHTTLEPEPFKCLLRHLLTFISTSDLAAWPVYWASIEFFRTYASKRVKK